MSTTKKAVIFSDGKIKRFEKIVKQQTETLKKFYSKQEDISEEIHPIAKVFIIADAFVKTMLDSSAPKNKKEILQILYLQFPSESFQKIIQALEQKIE